MGRYYEILNFKEETKLLDEMMKARTICPRCGHSILLLKRERDICNICNHWVYKNEKVEFKYKIRERMLRRDL